MKEIKVKAIFGTWQGYQEIVNYPPKGVRYIDVSTETSKGNYYEKKKIKEKLSVLLQKLKIPRMLPIKSGDFDLIHSSRGIIPITKKPWVMDIEHVHSFFGLNPDFLKKKFWRKFIEKILSRDNCKGILCHCEATRKAFFHYLNCEKFKNKIKVLYPSSYLINLEKKPSKKIRILCVISLFYNKGGPQVLKAFTELEKKYDNIELILKSDVPKKYKEKFNSKNIKYIPYFGKITPREELLKELYGDADIFLYPTMCDSFGYSFIDAMVAGLPIITTNLFASPEMVKDGKNGFIVKIPGYGLEPEFKQEFHHEKLVGKKEEKFIQFLIKNLEKLILNKKLREKMGEESFKMVSLGKFSIKTRNDKLRKIYEDALK